MTTSRWHGAADIGGCLQRSSGMTRNNSRTLGNTHTTKLSDYGLRRDDNDVEVQSRALVGLV